MEIFNNNNNIQQCILLEIHKVVRILYTLQIAIKIIKALLNYTLRKKEKKRNASTTHSKKNPSHKLKHRAFVTRKKD